MKLVVILPVSRPDFHLAVQWLRWVYRLNSSPFDLLVVPAASVLPAEVGMLNDLAFPCVEQIKESYERPELGYAAAANHLFRSALELAEKLHPGQPILWVEADCIPTRAEWVDEISEEYAGCGKPFLGDFHAAGEIPHMTGNAVYPADWRVKAPSIARLPFPRPEQGWDTLCAHETVPQMAKSKRIQQQWIVPRITPDNLQEWVRPETALFHRVKDGSLIEVLSAQIGIPIKLDPPLVAPTSVVDYRPVPVSVSPVPILRAGILIVTFARDIEFLRFCLKSIKDHCVGFMSVTVAVPRDEAHLFGWVAKYAKLAVFAEPPGKGMMAHEIQKCRADELCLDVDYVVHVDADCQFFRAVTPANYISNGKCLAVIEPYIRITNPNRHIWADTVSNAIGIKPIYDYMVRHPQVHPIDVYSQTRVAVEGYTGTRFDEYVLGCESRFPQGFAEFPTLSTFGHTYMPSRYYDVVYDKAADAALCGQAEDSFQYVYRRDRDFLVERWSHGGISSYRGDCVCVANGQIPEYWVK